MDVSLEIPHAYSITVGLKALSPPLPHEALQNHSKQFQWPCGCQFENHILHCCLCNINTSW